MEDAWSIIQGDVGDKVVPFSSDINRRLQELAHSTTPAVPTTPSVPNTAPAPTDPPAVETEATPPNPFKKLRREIEDADAPGELTPKHKQALYALCDAGGGWVAIDQIANHPNVGWRADVSGRFGKMRTDSCSWLHDRGWYIDRHSQEPKARLAQNDPSPAKRRP